MYSVLDWFSNCSAQTPYSAFQQAVVRNVNDKNGQLQKQLDNVIREGKLKWMVCSAISFITNLLPYNLANGEMNLMNNKKTGKVRFLVIYCRPHGWCRTGTWSGTGTKKGARAAGNSQGERQRIPKAESLMLLVCSRGSYLSSSIWQIQLDKIKRKTLFGPTNENSHGQALFPPNQYLDKARSHAVNTSSNNVDLTAVVGGMEANGVRIKV